ncbi:TonB-dependent siderophore receptor [Volucribacter amazonae]|uniref:TonB-dependent siderophore receptor n=1 Tax=Volucribacter amazonae TaxID=256731 RepID=A0A9X4P9G1_9PAST|nr:TonB-dependent siderophore receptor [Volucribacter amazonae]MDG6895100.1 TonB-dependent siderophore receptor [Volucribacter amazonae]
MSTKFRLTSISLIVLGTLASSSLLAEQNSNTVTLDEIVISAHQGTKVETDIVTLPEMDEGTATDMRTVLAKEPSIDFGGGNGTSQFLTIRGMGQNSVDIKVDNAYSDSQILYHQGRFIIDPSLLKSISVQKGAGAASAGIGATNGAIIAKTVDALDLLANSQRDYGFKLNTGYASNDGYSYGATVFGKAGHFDALISFNRINDHDYKPGKGFENFEGGGTVPYSALDKRSYLIKLGATFANHRFVLSHLSDQHRGVRLVREEFAIGGPRLTLARQSPAYRETTLTNTNLEWTAKELGFISELTANAYFMQNKRYSADDSGCGYCGNVEGPTTTKINTRGFNINLDSPLGQNTLIKYGVNYRDQKIIPHAFLLPNYSLTEPKKTDVGNYVEVIHSISDFILTGGLRYDYFNLKAMDGKSVSDGRFNPSFGLIWMPLENLSFNINHNYASRSPRLYDALMTHGKRGVISIADGTVAERARNTELGFNYKYAGFTLAGSYFWQKINDALANPQDRHQVAGVRVRETVNAGYIKNHGYELSASYEYNGFTARVGVAQSKPRIYDTHPDNLLSANPEFAVQVGRTWTAGLAYRFTQPNLELGWRNRTVQDAKGSVLVRDTTEVERNGYTVHDFYLNWKPFNNDDMNVNVSLNNAFNKFYYPHTQRGDTLPGIGRNFTVGVNYTF